MIDIKLQYIDEFIQVKYDFGSVYARPRQSIYRIIMIRNVRNNRDNDLLQLCFRMCLFEYIIISKLRQPIAHKVPIKTPYIPKSIVNIKLPVMHIVASIKALFLVSLKCPAAFISALFGSLLIFSMCMHTKIRAYSR